MAKKDPASSTLVVLVLLLRLDSVGLGWPLVVVLLMLLGKPPGRACSTGGGGRHGAGGGREGSGADGRSAGAGGPLGRRAAQSCVSSGPKTGRTPCHAFDMCLGGGEVVRLTCSSM